MPVRPFDNKVVLQNPPNFSWPLDRRANTIDPEVTKAIFPIPEDLKSTVTKDHPRIFTNKKQLAEFRKRQKTVVRDYWPVFTEILEEDMIGPLESEPDYIGNDYSMVEKTINGPTIRLTGRMARLAFGYLISNDGKYANQAKKIAMELVTWDPNGSTSLRNADQSFRDIVWRLSMAYDWLYDTLTQEEKKLILSAILRRGAELFY